MINPITELRGEYPVVTPTSMRKTPLRLLSYSTKHNPENNTILGNAMWLVERIMETEGISDYTKMPLCLCCYLADPTEISKGTPTISATYGGGNKMARVPAANTTPYVEAIFKETKSYDVRIEYDSGILSVEWSMNPDTEEYEENNIYYIVAPGWHTTDDVYMDAVDIQLWYLATLRKHNS